MTARDHLPPDLLALLDAARSRLSAKLRWAATPTWVAGRKPLWWREEWP